ncbi:hypothetical protein AJ78_04444 [Emergomyces pasteurianus Ep9510]|uniref:Uncharacterized protein n=1 Tax=Emergomyces pasteurianus Ep9510 TaxID=1447872 RepID=A0A1J9QGJ9_9EURO|nr:hypothetical protein AJ78_04444 [Emergomyces pasteurianus Ep9510]
MLHRSLVALFEYWPLIHVDIYTDVALHTSLAAHSVDPHAEGGNLILLLHTKGRVFYYYKGHWVIFERLLAMSQILRFLSWLGHNPNPTPPDESSNGQAKDDSDIRAVPMLPGCSLYQFISSDIEEIEEYCGVMYDLHSTAILFTAKTKYGRMRGKSDWQTFIEAKGARDAVERSGERFEELVSKYGGSIWDVGCWEAMRWHWTRRIPSIRSGNFN